MARPKGSPNKTTTAVKEAIIEAFDKLGGVSTLVTWGKANPSEFYGLWGRLAPREVNAEISGKDGGAIQVMMIGGKEVKF